MLDVLAYAGILFVVFGSWAMPMAFANWWGGDYQRGKTIGLWLMIAVDAALIWFWFAGPR